MSVVESRFHKVNKKLSLAISAIVSLTGAGASTNIFAAEEQALEEIVVLGSARTFSATTTTESMQLQQNPITSILSGIDNLPGVNVTEGDTFGFDDWSTTINVRGYQNNLSEQQIGITIDGLPNGESNYGGGAKANRYIDSANAGAVEVNQGSADISSRSLEALGGTLNFTTNDPEDMERVRFQVSTGDFNASRYYGRYDTGSILNDTTKAWISISHQEATDWMEGSAQNENDHLAAKFITELETTNITGYFSYDDTHEDNYQRITSAEFSVNPEWDRLTGDWTGIPYVDQLYRRGWSTLRENLFGYLKFDFQLSENLDLNVAGYAHSMEGRGDWVPPYIVDVIDNGVDGHSELVPGVTVNGGSPIGSIYYVDADGYSLEPIDGCTSSITFPYGGAGAEYDPACYVDGAIGVQSYRHTHYDRERFGLTADFSYASELSEGVDNVLRGGLWYEDSTRSEYRDWHKIVDTRAGYHFENPAYWRQYDLEFPRDTINYYLADTVTISDFAISLGLRQFDVDSSKSDNFGVNATESLKSDTDVLFSFGATYQAPIEGFEIFAGYSENVKPLTDAILERDGVDINNIEAETAENMEFGVRYRSSNLVGSAVYFDNEFKNRLQFFSEQDITDGGINIPNYLGGTAGTVRNVGGITSSGMELALSMEIDDNWSVYSSYTYTDTEYLGTGLGVAVDELLGITPGNTVVGTPENMFVVSLDWTRNYYSAGLTSKFVDDRFFDLDNTAVAKSYTVQDLYFNVDGEAVGDVLKGFQLSFVINNLADESYLGGISGFGAWIGTPRTAVFSVTADF